MANIGFFVLPNESSLNARACLQTHHGPAPLLDPALSESRVRATLQTRPSLKLAADLRARGHRIYYVGLQDSAEYIATNGFDFVPVFGRHFPRGFHQAVASMETPKTWRETYVLGRRFIRNYKTFVSSLISGDDTTFQEALRECRLEIMIFVSDYYFIYWPALLAYKAGVPGVYFSYMFGPRVNSATPPIDSSLMPSDSYWSHTRVLLE